MKFHLLNLLFCVLTGMTMAQNEGDISVVDQATNPAQFIDEFDLREKTLKGTYFLQDSWSTGTINLKNGKQISDYPLRFDIENNQMEIKVEDQVKVLGTEDIESFVWLNQESGNKSSFENCSHFHYLDGVPLIGVFEILVDGKLKLVSKTDTKFQESNYNVALDVGDRNDKIVKVKKQYLAEGVVLHEYPSAKKELAEFFGEKAMEMEEYIKDNSLKFKKKEDAITIFEHYNSLQ